MKKPFVFFLALLLLAVPLGASAQRGQHPPAGAEQVYHDGDRPGDRDISMPFKWREDRENFAPEQHRLERVNDRALLDRFPGMHPYRWHDKRGNGFMYHGQRIVDAVFFYDEGDTLISIGFMHEGAFIRISVDRDEERSHDTFFRTWMQHH